MSDDPHDEFPLAPQDDLRDADASAPQAIVVPDADRKRLEALLQELLRHDSVREVLCGKQELALQRGDAE